MAVCGHKLKKLQKQIRVCGIKGLSLHPQTQGQIPEWTNGADCKSAGFRLRWFESIFAHIHDLKGVLGFFLHLLFFIPSMRSFVLQVLMLSLSLSALAQPDLVSKSQKANADTRVSTPFEPVFTILCQNPITSVKDQHRSGTCWDYATLAFFESEILRKSGRSFDLCEMFVANKDYMDCATHYVRMHGLSELTQGGSADDVLDVLRNHGICPEEAMPAPGSLVGDTLANFDSFFPLYETLVRRMVPARSKHPVRGWQDSVQHVIDSHLGTCPDQFTYQGKTYTPRSFADQLGLDWDDYVSLTSFTHHPYHRWFVIESPYKWRLKPSYNLPLDTLVQILDQALEAGYCVAWGGDVSGDFSYRGIGDLSRDVQPTPQVRQALFDNWTFTYDHVMLIYGIAKDQTGKRYYLVKNSWGSRAGYGGSWYLSEDYIRLYTTYLFLNRQALSPQLRNLLTSHSF